jgi:choline dehydrogenase-like flavoprotein
MSVPTQPPWLGQPRMGELDADIVVIGTGMGGAAAAWGLCNSGARVLLLERGDFLPRETQNWSPEEVFGRGRYKNAETWDDAATHQPFTRGVHYYVGGNTKVYGASLPRFREEDFADLEHHEGISPRWPFSYADIEPFYCAAEAMLGVHGQPGEDPTDPWRSQPLPAPALEHEPSVAALADSMRKRGLTPFHMPLGVNYGPDGNCIRCRTCDGFPCKLGAKNDAETCGVLPALQCANVQMLTHATVRRLEVDRSGRTVEAALVEHPSGRIRVRGSRFVLAAGAVNSTAVLLRSASTANPDGLGNSSGQLGCNYMVHNSTFLIGIDPRRRNDVSFQKTLGLNDWYLAGPDTPYPLGNVQMLGKLQAAMVKPARAAISTPMLELATKRSIDLYLTTEDLPSAENRVTLGPSGRIQIAWTPNNLQPHRELLHRMRKVLRHAGYPVLFHQRMGIETNSHMCGTAVMGEDPSKSVLDPDGKAHEMTNLWLTDSSGFVSSAAMNPALTIAANALRIIARAGLAGPPVQAAPQDVSERP